MRKSIKDYPVRIISPPGKRKGRPSKFEIELSKKISNACLASLNLGSIPCVSK